MPDTLIMVKGILNDGCRDDEQPNMVIKTFVARHDTDDQLRAYVNTFLEDTAKVGGLSVVKDQRLQRSVQNSVFYPTHMFARLEFETKTINGQYDQEGTHQ